MTAPIRYIRDLAARPTMTVRAHELCACQPGLAERTHSQLTQLFQDFIPDRCDLIFRSLHEVATTVRQLATELERGDPPTV